MKKNPKWFLLLILLFSGMPVFAEERLVTHYELRTGVVFAWANSSGVWQDGIAADKIYNKVHPTSYDIGALYPKCKVENVKVYPYTLDFDFSKLGDNWSKTQFASDKDTYNENYYYQAASSIKVKDTWNAETGKLEYTYSATLTSINEKPIDVKAALRIGMVNDIYAMMGYTAATVPADIKAAMDELYPKAGQSEKVQGFLYFIPLIIQYDVVPEPAVALLPPKARINCAGSSAFIGRDTRVKGSVTNQNPFPVIMHYDLTVNGASLSPGYKVVPAKGSIPISYDYPIPSTAKPGTIYTFQITARNIIKAEDPPAQFSYSYEGNDHQGTYTQAEWDTLLSRQSSQVRREMEARVTKQITGEWTSYMTTHAQDNKTQAWHLQDGEWKTGVSNKCPRTAVPLPEAPLDHGLNPAVIVK